MTLNKNLALNDESKIYGESEFSQSNSPLLDDEEFDEINSQPIKNKTKEILQEINEETNETRENFEVK